MSIAVRPTLVLAAALSLTLAACGDGSDAAAPSTSTPSTAAPAAAEDEMAEDEMVMAAWQSLEITDVKGERFTIADFVGTPVFVENFATWCPNCREQLGKTNEAAAELGDGAVFLALSIETELDPDDVAAYAADNGFTSIRFAVMSAELLAAFSQELGNSAVNPPSTPHIVVDAMGHAGELVTGFEDPADIVASLGHDGQ